MHCGAAVLRVSSEFLIIINTGRGPADPVVLLTAPARDDIALTKSDAAATD